MKILSPLSCLAVLFPGIAWVALSLEQATRFGEDLTPLCAEQAGNANGSIAEWNQANLITPEEFVPGSDIYVTPYRHE